MQKLFALILLLAPLALPVAATPNPPPAVTHSVTVNTNGVLQGGDTNLFNANKALVVQAVTSDPTLLQANGDPAYFVMGDGSFQHNNTVGTDPDIFADSGNLTALSFNMAGVNIAAPMSGYQLTTANQISWTDNANNGMSFGGGWGTITLDGAWLDFSHATGNYFVLGDDNGGWWIDPTGTTYFMNQGVRFYTGAGGSPYAYQQMNLPTGGTIYMGNIGDTTTLSQGNGLEGYAYGCSVPSFALDADTGDIHAAGTIYQNGAPVLTGESDPNYFSNPNGYVSSGSGISAFYNDAGYSTFSPSGWVAYQGDNVSEFYNDAGYSTFSPSGWVAYQGDNVSEFYNDVGYARWGDSVSSFNNDAGYIAAESVFANWLTTNTPTYQQVLTTNYTLLNLDGTTNAILYFVNGVLVAPPLYYAFAYISADTNGYVSGTTNQTVVRGGDGTTVTAVVTSPLWSFDYWSDGVSTPNRTDLNAQSNITATAHFHADVKFYSGVTVDPSGKFTVTGDAPIYAGVNGYFAHPSSVTQISANGATTLDGSLDLSAETNLTSLGDQAFMNCRALRFVSMPYVTIVGYQTFFICQALTNVYMPNVVQLSPEALKSCASLRSITMPKISNIQAAVFNNTPITNMDIGGSPLSGVDFKAIHDFSTPLAVTHLNIQGCSNLSLANIPSTSGHYDYSATTSTNAVAQLNAAGWTGTYH